MAIALINNSRLYDCDRIFIMSGGVLTFAPKIIWIEYIVILLLVIRGDTIDD